MLFQDGPRGIRNRVRLALLDPAIGEKDWLPPNEDAADFVGPPLELSEDRLLFFGHAGARGAAPVVHAFDRESRTWSSTTWPGLPRGDGNSFPPMPVLGPDGRLYVGVPATSGEPPEGGWPTDGSGEADDAGAEGDTYQLWSLSASDPDDVRDEGLRVGSFAFTDEALVWTETAGGVNDRIHVRDLSTGEEHDFDPDSGDRCNLLSFGAAGDRIVLGQYCGTYADGVRDDRVQVLSTDGEQVVTIQGNGFDGGLVDSSTGQSTLVRVESYPGAQGGTYVYDLASGRFLRLSEATSKYGLGDGPAPAGQLLWHTPVNRRHGATQWLGELLD